MKLTDIIKNYVEQPDTDFAILINGQWGSGKTYFLKNDISKVINSIKYDEARKESKNYELIYVSLYGITTADELQKKLFLEFNPILKTRVGKITSTLMTKTLAFFGVDIDGQDQKNLLSIFGNIPKYKILVFDDLERLETNTLNEVLGFINSYTEHQNIKVIIVADEEKIQKKLPDYKSIKEKLIRFSYLYNPDLKEVFSSFVDRYKTKEYQIFLTERKQMICNLFDKGEHKNLRSLRFVLDLFQQLFVGLFEDKEIDRNIGNTILDRFLFFFITYSIAFKKGAEQDDLHSLKQLSSEIDIPINRIFFHLLIQNNEEKQEQTLEGVEKFKKEFEKAYIDDSKNEFEYFGFLANYIHTGDLSLSDLTSVSLEIQQKIKDREQKPEQIALDKLKNCLELNDEEFTPLIQEIYSYVQEGVYKLEVYPSLFQNILNCSINGIDNIRVDKETVELFKEGMKKSLPASRYKHGLNNNIYVQEPKRELLDEIRKYSEELMDSLLISNDAEIANKIFNLFKEENFKELSDFLLSEDVQSNPIFQEEFINPSDFLTKFNELTNLKKTKTLDLLRGFSRRFTNYGGGLKKEFPFFSKLLALVEYEIKKWKGNFHLSTQILIQLQGILTPIVDRLKKIGEGTYY